MEGDAGGASPAGPTTGGSLPPSGSVPSAGWNPIGGGPGRKLVYDGRLGELYRIFLINLLLTIVTLGVYRFWGKTRIRRYLWSHLAYDGDRFEYTGTGGELFRGFLVVAAVLAVIGICIAVSELVLIAAFDGDLLKVQLVYSLISFVFYLVLVYLLPVGQYMALRYRLSRSRWRGIRGALAGSPWRYGVAAFAWKLAVGASLGFAKPVADVSLARMRLRNLFFGTARAQLQSSSSTTGLYGPFVGSWFAMLLAIVVFAALVTAFNMAIAQIVTATPPDPSAGEGPFDLEQVLDDPRLWQFFLPMMGAMLVAGALAWTVVLFFRSWYWAALGNRLGQMTELAGLRVAPGLRMGRLGRLVAGNFLIVVFTLGLGTPIMLHRTWRFLADQLHIPGTLDGAAIGQSQQPVPGRGEGLLDALDAGGAF